MAFRQHYVSRQGLLTLLSLAVVVPLGFYSKFYNGPAAFWVNNSLGGLFYVIFWNLLFFWIWEIRKPGKLVGLVLVGTCGLEWLQLWHPPFLRWLRASFIGQTLLGTTFVPSDFLYYLLGAAISWVWLRRLAGFQADETKDDGNG